MVVDNPDTEVRPGTLQALLERLREHTRTGVFAPLLEDADGRLAPNGYRRFPGPVTLGVNLCLPIGYALAHVPALHPYAMSPAALRAGVRPAHVCGAALAIRRRAYVQAGPSTRLPSRALPAHRQRASGPRCPDVARRTPERPSR